jgi:hypothetical protein
VGVGVGVNVGVGDGDIGGPGHGYSVVHKIQCAYSNGSLIPNVVTSTKSSELQEYIGGVWLPPKLINSKHPLNIWFGFEDEMASVK